MNTAKNRNKLSEVFFILVLGVAVPGYTQIALGRYLRAVIIALLPLLAILGLELSVFRDANLMLIFGGLSLVTFVGCAWDSIRCALTLPRPKSKTPWYYLVLIYSLDSITYSAIGFLNHSKSYFVPAGSMVPTYFVGDSLMADTHYGKKLKPSRGDVVVFKYPIDPEIIFVKRVVAVGGDLISMKNKVLNVNGVDLKQQEVSKEELATLLKNEYLQENQGLKILREVSDASSYKIAIDPKSLFSENFDSIKVPSDQYFVMGDNRDNSKDSRFWGFLPLANIQGKVIYSYKSPFTRRRSNH